MNTPITDHEREQLETIMNAMDYAETEAERVKFQGILDELCQRFYGATHD